MLVAALRCAHLRITIVERPRAQRIRRAGIAILFDVERAHTCRLYGRSVVIVTTRRGARASVSPDSAIHCGNFRPGFIGPIAGAATLQEGKDGPINFFRKRQLPEWVRTQEVKDGPAYCKSLRALQQNLPARSGRAQNVPVRTLGTEGAR
jgi:hypothetical protein